MIIDIQRVKIFVTIPDGEYVEKVRKAICQVGAGVIGNYSYCSTATKCIGTFRPNSNANPYLGTKDNLEIVKECKLEVLCNIDIVSRVVKVIRDVHPYEEPAIDIVPLIDEDAFK